MGMSDVEREAQAFGHECGWNRTISDRYKRYGHLQRAWQRGFDMGLQDRERIDKQERIQSGIQDNSGV